MNAEKMFENLGWEKVEDETSCMMYKSGYRTIYFLQNDRWIVTSAGPMSMDDLKAINTQCKELGWLDEKMES